MRKFNKGSALQLFFFATITIVAFGASQGIAKELDTSNSNNQIAAHGGHGGGGGGDFGRGGGGREEFRDGGERFDHGNFDGERRVVDYDSGFVSPYNSTEYYYDDPDLPDAVDTPPEDYYEQSTFENN